MVSPAASSLSMQVQLFISGRKLKNLDILSKSDPRCSLFEQINNKWVLKGQTEMQNNQLNPDFTTCITIDYFFEKTQKLKFVMDDGDSKTTSEEIGIVETTLAGIMGKRAQTFEAELIHNQHKNRGNIIVRAESIKQSNKTLNFQISWQNCGNVTAGCCGTTANSVCFQFFRKVGAGWVKTYTTPYSMNIFTGPL